MKTILLGFLAVFLGACQKQNSPPQSTDIQVAQYVSSNECFTVESNIQHKMKLHAYFPFYFAIVDSCVPLTEISDINYYAEMPAHGHGMNSMPEITATHIAGEYAVKGSMFHMPGDWLATIEIRYGNKLEIIQVALSL
ncbi:hypothetical protein [Marinagarivorans cellulosilyticus]|uniref:YtkA-like domain-containing protein n=1 Tax=Marinagarivorans cellulosilyticus TaxID=2721545 RepID=A0AAN1WGT4_9GAMM|nr:hypothetical protein [Marinagarivorans cellulosilyticus]BCD97331.1 hypothetical protein MARGE09_P1532 [Marinagarivorans cellulosilyticus]